METTTLFSLFSMIIGLFFLLHAYFIFPRKKSWKKSERKIVLIVGWLLFLSSLIILLERLFLDY